MPRDADGTFRAIGLTTRRASCRPPARRPRRVIVSA
jgi:hypothetical protein